MAGTTFSGPAAAQQPNGAAPASQRIVEVRVALSPGAAQHLGEARVRRLLEIELGDAAVLAPGAGGPLGDHVAYVWIDESPPAHYALEVRIADRPVSRRELNLEGFPNDVATRFAVVATAEMVRAQMQPLPKRRSAPERRKPTAEELERAGRARPAVGLAAGLEAVWLPEVRGGLAGPSLGASFRAFGASQTLFARLSSGHTDAGSTRLLEAGLGLDYRFWLAPGVRLGVGGAAALGSAHLGDAISVDGLPGMTDTWSARAGGLVSIEGRVLPGGWLGLSLEPGALLRPIPYATSMGAGSLRGATLGARIAFTFERVSPPPPP